MISYCVAITIFCLVCFEAVAWTWWRFKKMHFIWVSMYLAQKCYLGSLFLRLLTETGPPFFVVIRATRRSSRLQYRGVPSFLSYFKTRTRDFPLCSCPLFCLALPLSFSVSKMESGKVVLTFESVVKMLYCDHSNCTSLRVPSHGSICFFSIYKMEFGNFVELWFWPPLGVKRS